MQPSPPLPSPIPLITLPTNKRMGEHHHGHEGMGNAIDHGLGGGGVAGHCCALHAFLVGVASPVLISLFANLGRGERLEVGSDLFTGLTGSRLDRPPRSHLSF